MFTDQYNISISDHQRIALIEVLIKLKETNPQLFNEDAPFEYWIECLQDIVEENEDYPIHNLYL